MTNRYLLIDAGGTNIKMGLMVNHEIALTACVPSNSANGFTANITTIDAIASDWLGSEKLTGIGIAFAGLVDSDQNKVLSVNAKFADAVNFDFNQWAHASYNCPLVMENDARAALIGEWKHGAGQGCDNIVMLTLGTGIGSAALINGQVLRGRHYQAGSLVGHFTLDCNGNPCNCGNVGCAETIGSAWVLSDLVKNHPGYNHSLFLHEKQIDLEAVFRLAKQNDRVANRIRNNCLNSWACVAVNAIHAYDPEMLILGGGVMKSGSEILFHMNHHISEHAWTPWGNVEIKAAQLENNAALWGISYMIGIKSITYQNL